MESLHNALQGGATRIELCSSLALGGLTPSYGFMVAAAKAVTKHIVESNQERRQGQQEMDTPRRLETGETKINQLSVPIYAMIRPRQGDFLYSQDDIDVMLLDIDAAAKAELQGVVFGTLTADRDVDKHALEKLVKRAVHHRLGITFHRAIDHCRDYRRAIIDICSVSMKSAQTRQHTQDDKIGHGMGYGSCIVGIERILTSGLAPTAQEGMDVIKDMVELSKTTGMIIMAGAGVSAENAKRITQETGVTEVHLSGKTVRASEMKTHQGEATTSTIGTKEIAKMGSTDDFLIPVTNRYTILAVVKALKDVML